MGTRNPAAVTTQDPPPVLDHRVQFYETDDVLIQSVADFLRPDEADGASIMVATPAHRDAFLRHMAAANVDVARRVGEGRLVMLDAAETLDRFLVEGMPDASAFDASIGALIRSVGALGGPVRVYGEMVTLLWELGNVPGAIALEDLWNGLGARCRFTLLCGYPSTLFIGPHSADDFGAVCQHHTAVTVDRGRAGATVPTDPVERTTQVLWQFPADPRAGSSARRKLRDLLSKWGMLDILDEAELLTTEIINNAVMHAGSRVEVAVTRHRLGLRVEVMDFGPGVLSPRAAGISASGRGVMLVHAMSSAWGTAVASGSKTVWFQLAV